MWLDRRPGQHPGSAAPPPNNRSVSPLPQRTSSRGPYLAPQRPGLNTRGSSALSLVSNDSSSSLLASAKKANGSSLRQSSTVDDAPDPEEVLARILGQFPSSNTTQQPEAKPASGITEDDLDFDVDFGGLTLTELAGPDVSSRQVDNYKPQSVQDCTMPPYCSYRVLLSIHAYKVLSR